MKRKYDDDDLLTPKELAAAENVRESYIRHARLKLGLKFYALDEIKIRYGDWKVFKNTRLHNAG